MGILKWVLIVAAVLVAAGAVIYGIGMSLPERHVARVERVIALAPDVAASRIRDVRAYPEWRHGVTVEVTEEGGNTVSFVETADGDRIAFHMTELEPGRRFISMITDQTLPFGGYWSFALEPESPEATRFIIEEHGFVTDPFYRFFAHYVFGYESTLKGYLDALEASRSRPATD